MLVMLWYINEANGYTHMSIMHCYAKHFFPSICSTLGFTRINKISGWNWFSWSWHMNTDWPWQRLGKKEVILPKKPICLETFRSNKRQKGSSSNCVDYPNNTIEGFLFLIFFKYWTCNSTNPPNWRASCLCTEKTLQVTKKLQLHWFLSLNLDFYANILGSYSTSPFCRIVHLVN